MCFTSHYDLKGLKNVQNPQKLCLKKIYEFFLVTAIKFYIVKSKTVLWSYKRLEVTEFSRKYMSCSIFWEILVFTDKNLKQAGLSWATLEPQFFLYN